MIKVLLGVVTMAVASLAHASVWQMEFPLVQNSQEVGHVFLATDGTQILSFPSSALSHSLERFLNDETKAWLSEQENVTPDQLVEFGIHLSLNMQTMKVEMALDKDVQAIRRIGLDSTSAETMPYSEAASWSVQNNVSLSHQHNNAQYSQLQSSYRSVVVR